MSRILPILVLSVVVAGCRLREPPTHTEVVDGALPPETQIPPAWASEKRTATPVAGQWLKTFNDPALEAIVAEAMANNLDLRQAADRVEVARQSIVVAGAQLLPQIGGQLGAKWTHDFGNESGVKHTFDHTVVSLGVAWELDVWGRLRAQRAAVVAGYEATALDYSYARQSLAATVAMSWYLTTEAHQLLTLAERAVQLYRGLFELAAIKRAAGRSSELDVVTSRVKLETAQSNLEATRNSYGHARRALEVLLGRYPAAEVKAATTYPLLPASTGAGVPSSLLRRRPDIVAAERLVLAAFRQQEAAQLALLPDFSINLVGGRVGDHLIRQLRLSSWLGSAAVGMTVPLYQGGALRAQVKIATAEQEQAVANYGSVVLRAFQEVEDALSNEATLAKRLPHDQRALVDSATAVRIATEQYQAGKRDLLWVEELQTDQLATEERVIKLRNAQIANRIRLYLALGGSFDTPPGWPNKRTRGDGAPD